MNSGHPLPALLATLNLKIVIENKTFYVTIGKYTKFAGLITTLTYLFNRKKNTRQKMANGVKENHKTLKCIDDDGATVCRASICSEKKI
jgi:hypothetical protein